MSVTINEKSVKIIGILIAVIGGLIAFIGGVKIGNSVAEKADKDGYSQVAKVFRAAAAAETIHAHNHLRAMGGINSTLENIKEAIEGEHYEFTKMYPEFLEEAKAESHKEAIRTFNYANEVEKVHHRLYQQALEALKKGNDLEKKDIYVCPVCGYTHEGEPPETCPVCGASKKVFNKID